MKRYRIDEQTARPIGDYGSSFRLLHLLRGESAGARVDFAFLSPGDFIARHPAGRPQLFCLIAGSGIVSGGDEIEHPISAGEAAFWSAGEHHHTRTETGLTAVIIQATELNPGLLLSEIAETPA